MDSSYFYFLLTSLFLISLSKFIIHQHRKRNPKKTLPPTPPALPLLGHLHLLPSKQPLYKTLQHLSREHGPVFSLRLGFRNTTVVSSPSAVEECFTKNDSVFLNRPRFLSGEYLNYNFTTLGATPYGPLWRSLRRLTAQEIFSKSRLDGFSGLRREEVKSLVKDLSRNCRRDFARVELKSKLSALSFNVVMRVVAGKRYFGDDVEGDAEAGRFRDLIREMSHLSGASNLGDFLPLVRWFDYGGLEQRMVRLQREMDGFLQGLVDEARNENLRGTNEGRNTMIESMLALQASEPEDYSDQIIKGVILVLLMAGTDTSSVTMEWAMSLLLNHPETLHKARDELDRHVGQGRLVDEHDISNLPYLQGIINESMRLYPAVPLLVPRESSEECRIGNFDIPKKTMLLVNAWAIHRDPLLWSDPQSFKPERHQRLGSEEEYKFKLVPFGMGRRKCPGAGFANRVVALGLGALIQCFEWERISGESVDMTEGGGLSMPKEKPLEAMCKAREGMTEVLLKL